MDGAALEVGRVAPAVLVEALGVGERVAEARDTAEAVPEVLHLTVHLERSVLGGDDGAALEALAGPASLELLGLGHGPAEGPGLVAAPHVLVADGARAHGDGTRGLGPVDGAALEVLRPP